MWDRVWSGWNCRETRKSPREKCRPSLESLEGRQVLNASLASLPNITSPQYIGYQVPLDGSQSNAATQTYTVTSSNPDIGATVAQGQFVTFNVSHTASSTPGDVSFNGPVTVQFFNDLTPITASKIEGFVNSSFYNGQQLFRVASGFPDANGYIIQGGSSTNTNSGVSGLPGTPFANEIVQELGFTNAGQLAMANTGQPNSNDTQFFFTTAAPGSLDYNYTVFGQVVSGQDIVNQMSKVAVTTNNPNNTTQPVNPIVMNTVTTSATNPNGVVHIDTTQAQAGETSTITVTATDPATSTTASQSFVVTVGAQNSTVLPLNLKPIAFPATQAYTVNTPVTIQLSGDPANSSTSANQTLSYTITTPPTNGTLSTPTSTGLVTYTPNANSQANDSFQFAVTNSGSKYTSIPKTVTLTTTPSQAPTAAPVTATSTFGRPVTIQLQGSNPNSGNNQAISYQNTTNPTQGTLSQLNPTTGSVVYTPNPGATGTDTFQYTVSNVGPPAPSLVSNTATVTINLNQPPVNTGAVRLIGNVLVVTPPPGASTNGKNTVEISETTDAAATIQVLVNGQLDLIQPAASSLDRIVAYGSKAGDTITVDPSVDPAIAVTLDGGHGKLNRTNVLQAGAGPTLENAWFGKNILKGGTGTNELIGRAGHVKFRPSTATDVIFAGMPHNYERTGRRLPPGGTFYKLNKKGKLVALPTPAIKPDYQDATVPSKKKV